MCRKAGLTETREKGRYRGPDDIDHRPHRFVQIQNLLVVAKTGRIKQANVTSKSLVSHPRNDQIGSLDQLLGELSLDVCDRIGSLLAQSGLDPGMHRLRLGVDPGRADDAGYVYRQALDNAAEITLERRPACGHSAAGRGAPG